MGGKGGKVSFGNLGTSRLAFWRTGRRVGDVSGDEEVSEVSIVSCTEVDRLQDTRNEIVCCYGVLSRR